MMPTTLLVTLLLSADAESDAVAALTVFKPHHHARRDQAR